MARPASATGSGSTAAAAGRRHVGCPPARPASPSRSDGWRRSCRPRTAARRSGSGTAPAAARSATSSAPIWVSAGAWSSAGLVVTGYGDALDDDGRRARPRSPGHDDRDLLVDGRPFPTRLGNPVARGDVVVSPSGRLVAANACGVRLCDAAGRRPRDAGRRSGRSQAAEGFLRVLTDDAIVTTDDDFDWISARRISDGAEVWRRPRQHPPRSGRDRRRVGGRGHGLARDRLGRRRDRRARRRRRPRPARRRRARPWPGSGPPCPAAGEGRRRSRRLRRVACTGGACPSTVLDLERAAPTALRRPSRSACRLRRSGSR